jgi:hypothetical protein
MRTFATAAILVIFFQVASLTQAGEADFLKRFDGNWIGGGSVKLRANSPVRKVACNLKSNTKADALSMAGVCRAVMIVTRRIGAELRVDGARYSGTYVDPAGKTSLLSGTRAGNTLKLAILWAKEVNGDRQAKMEIASLGNGRMRLRTIDADPRTGKPIITSDIELVRN